MTDRKISELTTHTTPADDDVFVVVDTSADTSKKIARSALIDSVSQSSATDSTAGKLLKVGAFGLGDFAPATDGSSNALDNLGLDTGFWRVLTAQVATVNGPTGAKGGVVEQLAFGSSNLFQRFSEVTNLGRSWTRWYSSSTWSIWTEVYTQSSILGTVSESGGVPTGAGIEEGSNSNGTYVRFADGTQICQVFLDGSTGGSAATAISTASGSMFTSSAFLTWTYPAAFVGSTNLDVNVHGNIRRGSTDATGINIYNVSTSTVTYVPWSSVSLAEADQKSFILTAVGKWF